MVIPCRPIKYVGIVVTDIEIYIREPVIKKVLGWIKSHLGSLQELPASTGAKNVRRYRTLEFQPEISISIQSGIDGGPYTCIWFDSPHTPWSSDIDCARDAFSAFALPVQCDPGPDSPHQDDFFRIDESGERIVRLKDGLLGSV